MLDTPQQPLATEDTQKNALIRYPQSMASLSDQIVCVDVNGRVLRLPEHVLRDGLSLLRLATEGYVGEEDYAEAVGSVLGALEELGILAFRQ